MDTYQYLLLMAACLAITLPLEFLFGARVYRRPLRLLLAVLPTVVLFGIWDIAGILRDHWGYNPQYVSGINLGPMPLEELVFFVVIPICGLLTYEAVGQVLTKATGRRPDGEAEPDASGGNATARAAANPDVTDRTVPEEKHA